MRFGLRNRHPRSARVSLGLTSLTAAALTLPAAARAEKFDNIEFPQGKLSFADAVVEYVGAPGADKGPIDPLDALGPPDYSGRDEYVTLGNATKTDTTSGLILEFRDNRLIDIPGDDLYVFEIGPAVESTLVSISEDGVLWYELGQLKGSTRGVDLEKFPELPPDGVYRFVRLRDDPSQTEGDGPDIDAVGAIGSYVTDENKDGVLDVDQGGTVVAGPRAGGVGGSRSIAASEPRSTTTDCSQPAARFCSVGDVGRGAQSCAPGVLLCALLAFPLARRRHLAKTRGA